MTEIIAIQAFNDNYIWLGHGDDTREVFVVDPGDSEPVLAYLNKHQLTLATILITHKHADHTGGVEILKKHYPSVAIYAHPQEGLAHITHLIQDGDHFHLNNWPTEFQVIHIPGHTLGHVAYYASPALFCGDTLFGAGCGRVFEGTLPQMYLTLEKLAALPDNTQIYCGHEYTLANLKFALKVDPENNSIQERIMHVQQCRERDLPSLPSTLALEKQTNPFLRCKAAGVVASVEQHAGRDLATPADVFGELRTWKNNFSG